LFSKLIRRATKSVWSHVGVLIRIDDEIMVAESLEPVGVRLFNLRHYLFDYDGRGNGYNGGLVVARYRHIVVLGDAELQARHDKARKYIMQNVNRRYDTDDLMRIAWRILCVDEDKKYPRIAPDDELICSEFADRVYNQAGLVVKWDCRGFIAPADFATDYCFELFAILKDD
jgi:hypothetical protein